MTLGKISIDDSVKYIPRSEQTKEKDIKPNTIKTRKKDKTISQTSNKNLKDIITVEGFRILK